MPAKISLIGKTFGSLFVINETARRKVGNAMRIYYLCRCKCGKEKVILSGALSSGATQSCGCFNIQRTKETHTTHGHSVGNGMSRTYSIWWKMKSRCYNPNQNQYADYGGRGIIVCPRWLESFENFLVDMSECPPGLSIDRIDVNGNYEPENCRWATMKEQHRNRRDNRIVTVAGFTGCFIEASEHFGIPDRVCRSRLRYGWTYDEIFLTPVRPIKDALG